MARRGVVLLGDEALGKADLGGMEWGGEVSVLVVLVVVVVGRRRRSRAWMW